MTLFVVRAARDNEAGVWYVSESDVPGLATEAESFDDWTLQNGSSFNSSGTGGKAEFQSIVVAPSKIENYVGFEANISC